jgi:hypothetical protein
MAISHVLVAKSILGTAAVWRQHILAAHPTDKRNTRASELLELLSAEPTASVPSEVVARLDGYSDSEFNRVAMLAARQVAFRVFPASLVAFLQEVMTRIDESRAEIDAAFPSTKREAAR